MTHPEIEAVLAEVERALRDDGGEAFVGRHMEIRKEWIEALVREVRRLRGRN